MNTPSPLVPQGTLPDQSKSRIRLTFFAILAIHVLVLGIFLIAGCKKTADTAQQDQVAPPPVVTPPEPPPLPPPTNPAPVVPIAMPDTNLPPPPPPPPPYVEPVAQTMSEHTIVKGESFAVLAKKYGVGTKAIEAANPGVNPTRLKIGQKIMIPPPKAGASGGAAPVNGGAVEFNGKVYVVKSGDNLMKIAKAHGVTAKQLRAYNGLRTDGIKVGQKLKIPSKAPTAPPAEATVPPPVPAPTPVQ